MQFAVKGTDKDWEKALEQKNDNKKKKRGGSGGVRYTKVHTRITRAEGGGFSCMHPPFHKHDF